MKKKIIKKFLYFIIMVFSIMCVGLFAKADGPLDGKIIDGSLLTSEETASDQKALVPEGNIIPYGMYLSNGSSNITKQGSGLVYVSGATYCYRVSDTVYVKLYLERLSNGGWTTVQTHEHATYNSDYAYTGLNYSVAKGYYYRVRGYHYAKKGSTIESVTTCTSGVYIN